MTGEDIDRVIRELSENLAFARMGREANAPELVPTVSTQTLQAAVDALKAYRALETEPVQDSAAVLEARRNEGFPHAILAVGRHLESFCDLKLPAPLMIAEAVVRADREITLLRSERAYPDA